MIEIQKKLMGDNMNKEIKKDNCHIHMLKKRRKLGKKSIGDIRLQKEYIKLMEFLDYAFENRKGEWNFSEIVESLNIHREKDS